jgi:hypothetical protein
MCILKQESQVCPSLKRNASQESFEEAPLWAAIVTYIGYGILNIFGWIRDFLRAIGVEKNAGAKDSNPPVKFALMVPTKFLFSALCCLCRTLFHCTPNTNAFTRATCIRESAMPSIDPYVRCPARLYQLWNVCQTTTTGPSVTRDVLLKHSTWAHTTTWALLKTRACAPCQQLKPLESTLLETVRQDRNSVDLTCF